MAKRTPSWSTLVPFSSQSASSNLFSVASTSASSVVGYSYTAVHICEAVRLSTQDGAQCECGKFAISVAALPIKSLTLGEMRQVVTSGYKLAHGSEPKVIRLANPDDTSLPGK